MIANKQYKYYAVVDIKTRKLIIHNGQLPVFWLKKIAKEAALTHIGSVVIPIWHDDMVELLNRSYNQHFGLS